MNKIYKLCSLINFCIKLINKQKKIQNKLKKLVIPNSLTNQMKFKKYKVPLKWLLLSYVLAST